MSVNLRRPCRRALAGGSSLPVKKACQYTIEVKMECGLTYSRNVALAGLLGPLLL